MPAGGMTVAVSYGGSRDDQEEAAMRNGLDEFGTDRTQRIAMADEALAQARSAAALWAYPAGFPSREIETDYLGCLSSAGAFYAVEGLKLMARRVGAIQRSSDVPAAWKRFDDLNARK